jgi:hypothetical protein
MGIVPAPKAFGASGHADFAVKRLKTRILQIFYMVCNGHPARTLVFIPKQKKEVHGKAGGKI